MKDDQNFWNFWLLVLSGAFLFLELWILAYLGKLPTGISLFDLTLIVFATFRLTRLFVYDTIMQFVRDLFLKKEVRTEDGKLYIKREKCQSGIKRALSDLFSCPWCAGLQLAILVVFFYYLTSLSWIVILMFAVGGAATFIQLAANAVGWRAEFYKKRVEGK
ncbi:MAG: DUF1360 domain-containing protein [Candidatus Paceibacterota bacterium]